jgi:hypothetical protein
MVVLALLYIPIPGVVVELWKWTGGDGDPFRSNSNGQHGKDCSWDYWATRKSNV